MCNVSRPDAEISDCKQDGVSCTPTEPKSSPSGSAPKRGFESLSRSNQLAILTCFMFVFFGGHNLLQEAILKEDGFQYGVMLAYMEVLGVTVCSYIERRFIYKEFGRVAPLKAYPLLTFCLMASSSLSNISLNYINFPTKVIFRSCKLLPTMIIATIMNKKVYSLIEYFCAFCVCAGLVVFAAADWRLTPSFHPFGLVIVSLSVVADSILPNAQEHLFCHGASRLEVTFYTNLFTLIAMTITTIASGDFMGVIELAMSNNQLALYMIVYTAISYVAVTSFMMIVKRFGAVVGVLLGTARKGMTIVLSFLLFPKPFSWYYMLGAGLVLGSILVVSLRKQYQKKSMGGNQKTHIDKSKMEMSKDIESKGETKEEMVPLIKEQQST